MIDVLHQFGDFRRRGQLFMQKSNNQKLLGFQAGRGELHSNWIKNYLFLCRDKRASLGKLVAGLVNCCCSGLSKDDAVNVATAFEECKRTTKIFI